MMHDPGRTVRRFWRQHYLPLALLTFFGTFAAVAWFAFGIADMLQPSLATAVPDSTGVSLTDASQVTELELNERYTLYEVIPFHLDVVYKEDDKYPGKEAYKLLPKGWLVDYDIDGECLPWEAYQVAYNLSQTLMALPDPQGVYRWTRIVPLGWMFAPTTPESEPYEVGWPCTEENVASHRKRTFMPKSSGHRTSDWLYPDPDQPRGMPMMVQYRPFALWEKSAVPMKGPHGRYIARYDAPLRLLLNYDLDKPVDWDRGVMNQLGLTKSNEGGFDGEIRIYEPRSAP